MSFISGLLKRETKKVWGKIPCPNCKQQIAVPERFAGKPFKCPACQQTFTVPGGEEAAGEEPPSSQQVADQAAAQSKAATALAPSEKMAAGALLDKKKAAEKGQPETPKKDPTQIESCPSCGRLWKKGSKECSRCHYNVFVGGKPRSGGKRGFGLGIDFSKVFLIAFLGGAGYGLYYMYEHWGDIEKGVNKQLDTSSRAKPSEEDDTLVISKGTKEKEGGK